MSKQNKDVYENARDLVLAAFIQILEKRVPTDRGLLAELRSYLVKFRGIHGDVQRVINKYERPTRPVMNFTDTDEAAEDVALSLISKLEGAQFADDAPAGIPVFKEIDTAEVSAFQIDENPPWSDYVDDNPEPDITTPETETPTPAKRGLKAQTPVEEATANIVAKKPKKCC